MQALLLCNIGDKELIAGELRTPGYYLGSNVSYNLEKLVDMGFRVARRPPLGAHPLDQQGCRRA